MRILSADWVLPVSGEPIRDGAVAIEGERLAAVGTQDELGRGEHHAEAAILPGFVNAHSHLEYAVYSGFGDGLPFAPWLATHIERKARLGRDEMLAVARRGACDSLATGITTTADYSYSGAAAAACDASGLRAIVYLEVFASDPADARAQFERTLEGTGETRATIGISPHAPYTCTPAVYEWCLSLGVPVGTHLAESEGENEWLLRGAGPMAGGKALVDPPAETGARMLARHGLLGPGLLCAHCVQLDDQEIDLLAAHDVPVAHCPRSNALLGCGIAPVAALRAAGLRVGLGTDSPASTPSFDVFAELQAAVLLARARERRPDALTAAEALELATLGSARAVGLGSEVGSLERGKRADLSVVSLAGSPYLPWEDPASAVVFGGSPERVVGTLVDGETRYDRERSEWQEVRSTSASARGRMLSV
jgi:cytosine/adenosine deaminase-related metal-dependent hydrolase